MDGFSPGELGFLLQKGTPSALFQWLTASFLARIKSSIAIDAAKSLNKQGWRIARRMTQSTWEQRVRALHDAGYARYQEKTTSMLAETANLLLDRYGGDILKLWKAATHRSDHARQLLKECKGIETSVWTSFFVNTDHLEGIISICRSASPAEGKKVETREYPKSPDQTYHTEKFTLIHRRFDANRSR
jgi:hypothetical protein